MGGAKEYLKQIGRYNIYIYQKKKEIDEIKVLLQELKYNDCVDKLNMLERKINEEIVQYVEERHKIINQIQGLQNEKYVDILFKHYIEMKSLAEIAADEHYTYEYIKLLHGQALKDFSNNVLQVN